MKKIILALAAAALLSMSPAVAQTTTSETPVAPLITEIPVPEVLGDCPANWFSDAGQKDFEEKFPGLEIRANKLNPDGSFSVLYDRRGTADWALAEASGETPLFLLAFTADGCYVTQINVTTEEAFEHFGYVEVDAAS